MINCIASSTAVSSAGWLTCSIAAALVCGCSEPVSAPEPAALDRVPAAITQTAPSLRLVVVADLEGVLEPCGCGGRPLGGVDRIAAIVTRLRKEPTPTLLVVAGNLFYAPKPHAKHTAQDALEADAMAAILARLRPDVIVPGSYDQSYAAPQLASLQQAAHAPLLTAGLPRDAAMIGQPSSLLGPAAHRIAITVGGAPGDSALLRGLGAQTIVRIAIEEDPEQREDTADITIATGSEAEESRRQGDVLRIDPGVGGESLWLIDLGTEGPRGALATRVELSEQIAPAADVRRLIDQTYTQVNALNVASATRAGAPQETHEDMAEQIAFVGSRTCAACHTSAYLWWQRTAHAHAYRTLQRRGRELDLDCIACHVTGFEQLGGARIGRLEELADVGCESCHGPGSKHADDPRSRRGRSRREVSATICASCHDPAHSPGFDFATWRERLLVRGHGGEQAHAPAGTPQAR